MWCVNFGGNIYKKKVLLQIETPLFFNDLFTYFLCLGSDDTDSFFRPLARRAASTFCPPTEDILSMKPCLLRRFLLEG